MSSRASTELKGVNRAFASLTKDKCAKRVKEEKAEGKEEEEEEEEEEEPFVTLRLDRPCSESGRRCRSVSRVA